MATINGTTGNDTLSGTAGDDTLNGFEGNDLFLAGSTGGNDVINGGAGRDSIEFKTRATSAIVVDFVAGTITGGSSGTISFTSIERILTGDFNDQLSGNGAGQTLTGQGGSDTIWGAGGVDTLWGGTGADSFVFRETGTANADGISDFASGSDKIVLDASVMTALGASGNFAAGDMRFVANSTGTAQDASDRIIYETDTRQVWYDPDGTGAAARQLIATLQVGATLVATDIMVEGGSSGQVITGTPGNDSLVGTTGDETIDGLGGDDTINGGGGSDVLIGGAGNDLLIGGFDDAFPSGYDPGDYFIGGDGDDTMDGNQHHGSVTVDTMDGGLGNDMYHVDNPADVLFDAGGVDTVIAYEIDWTLGAGFENLHLDTDVSESRTTGIGNELDNRMSLGYGGGRLEGRGGNDTLLGGVLQSTLLGGDGNDSIVGGFLVDGGAGNDTLTGRSDDGDEGNTFAFSVAPGLANADRITNFTSGGDTLRLDGSVHANAGSSGRFTPIDPRFYSAPGATAGQDADDRVIFNTSSGQLFYDADGSGPGAAQLIATLQAGASVAAVDIEIVNGAGPTVINGSQGDDSLVGTPGHDLIDGGDGNDYIVALEGDDTVFGASGNDSIRFSSASGYYGNDQVDGGSGFDWLVFGDGALSRVNVRFETGWVFGGGADGSGSVSFVGIEAVIGTVHGDFIDANYAWGSVGLHLDGYGGNDTVIGGSGDDTLRGGSGDDILDALGGADSLDAGPGNDTLYGGAGPDSFIFSVAPGAANADRVGDFASGVDMIRLDAQVMPELGASGNFSTADPRFYAAAGANAGHDADDRVVYNTTTGELWYDADGNGAVAAQLIATLKPTWPLDVGPPSLAATDIVVDNGSASGGQLINGTSANDSLVGGEGNDTLNGFGGDDTLDARGGDDVLDGGLGADLYLGGSGNDTLIDHEDEFGAAGDTLDGGLGDDLYDVRADPFRDTTNVYRDAGGVDTILSERIMTLPEGFENLELFEGPRGTGNALNNTITTYSNESALYYIDGADGNDTLIGGHDNVRYEFSVGSGNYGNDSVIGGRGRDTLDFGDARSSIVADFGAGTLSGGGTGGSGSVVFSGIEVIFGGSSADRLIANDGASYIDMGDPFFRGPTMVGGAGDDTLIGGAAEDFLAGDGAGLQFTDSRFGTHGSGDDEIRAGAGDDFILLSFTLADSYGNDFIDGGAGTDSLRLDIQLSSVTVDLQAGTFVGGGSGGTGSATLVDVENVSFVSDSSSTAGTADRMMGNAADNSFGAGGGDDFLDGRGGNDQLFGGAGSDQFMFSVAPGTANADVIWDFQSGADEVHLDVAVYTALGTTGRFSEGDERFAANATGTAVEADDRIIRNTTTHELWYDADGSGGGAALLIASGLAPVATDIVVVGQASSGGSEINGTPGADTLTGTAGDDTINGFDGNDLFVAGSTGGNDVINGGAGRDSIEFKERATSAITVDFVSGTITGGSSGTISFTNIERILTGNFDDTLTGNGASQTLTGQGGSDTIAGAGGTDTLWGAAGADVFVFREMGAANADRISDFATGSDKLHLDDAAFAAIGMMGNFSTDDVRFKANSSGTATDTNDRVVFNTSTGQLYYDADGSGSGAAAQLIATVQSGATVAATDILVV